MALEPLARRKHDTSFNTQFTCAHALLAVSLGIEVTMSMNCGKSMSKDCFIQTSWPESSCAPPEHAALRAIGTQLLLLSRPMQTYLVCVTLAQLPDCVLMKLWGPRLS